MGPANGAGLLPDFFLERPHVLLLLDDQLSPLEGLFHLAEHLFAFDGLDQVAVRSQGQRLDGRGRLLHGRQDDDLGLGPSLLDLRQEFYAGAAGHGEVQRDQVRLVPFQVVERLARAGRFPQRYPAPLSQRDTIPPERLVIDDEDVDLAAGGAFEPGDCPNLRSTSISPWESP